MQSQEQLVVSSNKRSCDYCVKYKRKCDKLLPACSRCVKAGKAETCHYTIRRKPGRKRKYQVSKDQNIEEESMESQGKRSSIDQLQSPDKTWLRENHAPTVSMPGHFPSTQTLAAVANKGTQDLGAHQTMLPPQPPNYPPIDPLTFSSPYHAQALGLGMFGCSAPFSPMSTMGPMGPLGPIGWTPNCAFNPFFQGAPFLNPFFAPQFFPGFTYPEVQQSQCLSQNASTMCNASSIAAQRKTEIEHGENTNALATCRNDQSIVKSKQTKNGLDNEQQKDELPSEKPDGSLKSTGGKENTKAFKENQRLYDTNSQEETCRNSGGQICEDNLMKETPSSHSTNMAQENENVIESSQLHFKATESSHPPMTQDKYSEEDHYSIKEEATDEEYKNSSLSDEKSRKDATESSHILFEGRESKTSISGNHEIRAESTGSSQPPLGAVKDQAELEKLGEPLHAPFAAVVEGQNTILNNEQCEGNSTHSELSHSLFSTKGGGDQKKKASNIHHEPNYISTGSSTPLTTMELDKKPLSDSNLSDEKTAGFVRFPFAAVDEESKNIIVSSSHSTEIGQCHQSHEDLSTLPKHLLVQDIVCPSNFRGTGWLAPSKA